MGLMCGRVMPVFSPGFALGFWLRQAARIRSILIFTPKVGFHEIPLTELQLFTDYGNAANGIGVNTVLLLTEETW